MSLVPHLKHYMMFVFVSLFLCMGSFISGGVASGLKQDDNKTITRFCHDNEMKALLDIKANLVDIKNHLQDWGNQENNDCCQWVGVSCNHQTGHVTRLDLSTDFDGLSGNTSPSLMLLSQLQYLDLSRIDFRLNPIPNSLSSLTNLRYLKLSSANLSGSIPDQLANLTDLIQLDLSSNLLSGSIPVSFENLTSLTHLDLPGNRLEGAIPKSFGNWSSLIQLNLSNNILNGSVPEFDGCSSSKEVISKSNSAYYKSRDSNFTGCPPLQILDLSRNGLNGNLPESVGKLQNLEHLDVSSNSLNGVISDVHFLNLTKLTYLDLSSNTFRVSFSPHARFDFKLETIKMRSCNLGPTFPAWIQTQRDFAYLDISNAGISDGIPDWFWDLPYGLKLMNLSSNELKGMLPNITSEFGCYPGMDLSYNQLEGRISVLPSRLAALNLSRNRFSGTLSFLCQISESLNFLDISNNLLSGSLPDCLQKFQETLVVLNLSNNSLSGEIPSFLGSFSQLQALYLRRNTFVGDIPMSLSNCTKLKFLDLGENKLTGKIPTWIGETLSELYVLVMWSNRLEGSVPPQMCLLRNLQFLDLSNNGLSGNIPRCIGNFTSMATRGIQDDIITHSYSYYKSSVHNQASYDALNRNSPALCERHRGTYSDSGENEGALFIDNAMIAWKGTRREFGKGLYQVKSIDISSNKLHGKLPDEITDLLDLVSLNLSNNKLHGQIPKHMGRLRSLESIDLSRNEFSGNIPSSLSELTSLSYLDISYNNLSGRIPTGTQLQGFNYTFYIGNPQLCGPPLTQRCGLPPPPVVEKKDVEEDGDELWISYYTGMGIGFTVGFSGFCGALFLNRWFRFIFFASLNNVKDWIYVIVVVHFRNLHTRFRW